MLPDGARLWKLSDAGPTSLGVSCTPDGLFLGRTALVERRGARYSVRSRRDVERLLRRAYGSSEVVIERLMPRLGYVAAALGERNLCLAQIAALHLRLPDLFDPIARAALEAEDTVLKASQQDERLARSGWDPAEHPRAGVPPNPGWFAPTGGEIAQNEEDERELDEPADRLAPVRQALWDAAIARLREIDPHNRKLSHLSNPDTAPSQAALDRLYAALEAAAIRRVAEGVTPGGIPIGEAGSSPDIRVVRGDLAAARKLFDYLRVGGSEHLSNSNRTVVKLPGNAGFLTFRQVSRSRGPAIDINVPGVFVKRIHFREK